MPPGRVALSPSQAAFMCAGCDGLQDAPIVPLPFQLPAPQRSVWAGGVYPGAVLRSEDLANLADLC